MKPRVWMTLVVLYSAILACPVAAWAQERDEYAPLPSTAVVDEAPPVTPSTAPATEPASDDDEQATPAPDVAVGDVDEARQQAMIELLAGKFEIGCQTLNRVLLVSPRDDLCSRLNTWVSGYLTRRGQAVAQQQREYDQAVQRTRRLLEVAHAAAGDEDLSHEALAQLRRQLKPARETVTALLTAPENAENYVQAVWYVQRTDADAGKIRQHLENMRQTLGQAQGVRAEAIRQAMEESLAAMETYRLAAADQDWSTPAVGTRSYAAIEDRADELVEAMTYDLADAISNNPWQEVLDRACVAKYILPDPARLLRESWLADVTTGAENQARAYEKEGKWHRAMMLYGGLANLYEETGRYKKDLDRATRHARVLSLYAPEAAKAAAEEDEEELLSTEDEPAQDQPAPAWKEVIHGVDAVTVRRALGLIEQYYVENVDYRRLLLSGLEAVRILATTPEVADTFEGLADAKALSAFVRHLDQLSLAAGKQAVVDHGEVARQLYSVLLANGRTVKIPPEVIDVEFTDGLTDELDRYTQVIWPEKLEEFQKQTMGSFEGIGVQIQVENGLLKVVSPLEDTPAYRAGLQAGDFILKIDGRDAKNIDINEAVRQITGPEGSKVTLTIHRPGQAPFDKAVARAKIQVQTVKGWKRANGTGWQWMIDPDNRIGYIRITNFNNDTTEHLQKALRELNGQEVRGLILDLRDNPGGLLNVAVEVANEFLRGGAIISTRGRDGQSRAPAEAARRGLYQSGPLVVLINMYSASASEIVSGALKDHGRALIVGRRSFGKGLVQNLVRIDENNGARANPAMLKVTAARYYLPSGRCLHRTDGADEWGVEPDIDVPMTPRQTRRWLTIRRQTEIIRDRNSDLLDGEMDRQFEADLQLNAALLICRLQASQSAMDLHLARGAAPPPAAGKPPPTEAVAK